MLVVKVTVYKVILLGPIFVGQNREPYFRDAMWLEISVVSLLPGPFSVGHCESNLFYRSRTVSTRNN